MVAFHAEQAVEKALKSVLEEYEGKVPKIHNVIRLKEMTERYLHVEADKSLLEKINEVYSDTRYPSDIGLVPTGKPSLEVAKQFDEFALRMKNEIKRQMSTGQWRPRSRLCLTLETPVSSWVVRESAPAWLSKCHVVETAEKGQANFITDIPKSRGIITRIAEAEGLRAP